MTEREKMALGLWYDANFDPELCAQRREAAALCLAFNNADPRDTEEKARLQKLLLPNASEEAYVTAPFQTDYGFNCCIGAGTDINRGAYLMDGAKITIGEHCFIGPNCGMYTANHPLCYEERNRGFEQAAPITIGDNVWIGGDVAIPPRGTIGEGGGDGAGSGGTQKNPPHTPAYGKPPQAPPPPLFSGRWAPTYPPLTETPPSGCPSAAGGASCFSL